MKDVRGKKMETQGKVGRRKDSQSFDKDVGGGLVTGEVRIELIPTQATASGVSESSKEL